MQKPVLPVQKFFHYKSNHTIRLVSSKINLPGLNAGQPDILNKYKFTAGAFRTAPGCSVTLTRLATTRFPDP